MDVRLRGDPAFEGMVYERIWSGVPFHYSKGIYTTEKLKRHIVIRLTAPLGAVFSLVNIFCKRFEELLEFNQ